MWESIDNDVKVIKKEATVSDIAQVPSAGYHKSGNYSKASIQWLEYKMELARQTLNIQHALNGGESEIPYRFKNRRTQEWETRNYKVDGQAGNVVYEFHGNIARSLIIIIITTISRLSLFFFQKQYIYLVVDVLADVLYKKVLNYILFVSGCFWHGCVKCYPDRAIKNPKTGQTMEQLYALTPIKENALKRMGYKYVCIWEHDWMKSVEESVGRALIKKS